MRPEEFHLRMRGRYDQTPTVGRPFPPEPESALVQPDARFTFSLPVLEGNPRLRAEIDANAVRPLDIGALGSADLYVIARYHVSSRHGGNLLRSTEDDCSGGVTDDAR